MHESTIIRQILAKRKIRISLLHYLETKLLYKVNERSGRVLHSVLDFCMGDFFLSPNVVGVVR